MRIYFSLFLLLSSSLLMLVQPMVARMLLPYLGGSPSVWNTCMVFFQAGLLIGYAYAHWGPQWLGIGQHAVLHGLLLLGAVALLPIELPAPHSAPVWPTLWMLRTLAIGVFVPYVLLASASSLAQAWFAKCTNDEPYSLYAASNLGSFVGLLSYPLCVEPNFTLHEQSQFWRNGFAAFVVLSLIAISLLWRRLIHSGEKSPRQAEPSSPPPTSRVVRWVLLALAPSSLTLSVTNHLTIDLASVPFLWAIPLGLYLLTFVVAFSRRPVLPHAVVVRYVPIAIFFLVFLWMSEATSPLVVIVFFDLLGFTWLALFCHGELAGSRPPADRLTEFYFWIALGGVLGGSLNVLLAPLLFPSYLEYPLIIVVIGALRPSGALPTSMIRATKGAWRASLALAARQRLLLPALIGGACLALVVLGRFLEIPSGSTFLVAVIFPLLATLFVKRADSYALAIALILATGLLWPSIHGDIIERRRSFFGVLRVTFDGEFVKLIHGNTVHGMQAPTNPREPLAYYHRGSPIAAVFELMNAQGQLSSVGVVGLGSGALSAYGQKGQSWTFFEIDPDVQDLAQKHFSYLARCHASVRIVLGDARLSLQSSVDKFDLLVIDAFGSDSIPTHLLTREALEVYAAHLNPGGLIAFHVSNRYLDLLPVLAALAEFGWQGWASDPESWPISAKDQAAGHLNSWWAVLARDPADVADICKNERWLPLVPSDSFQPWSDDFINLPAVVRWRHVFQSD